MSVDNEIGDVKKEIFLFNMASGFLSALGYSKSNDPAVNIVGSKAVDDLKRISSEYQSGVETIDEAVDDFDAVIKNLSTLQNS